jgi:hypothetical protein
MRCRLIFNDRISHSGLRQAADIGTRRTHNAGYCNLAEMHWLSFATGGRWGRRGPDIAVTGLLGEDFPRNQPSPQSGQQSGLLLGLFHGVRTTKKSIFHLPTGPDYIVLYQKNT